MDVAEKIISIGQPPAILRRGAGVFPFDFSVGGNDRHFARVGVGAYKRMLRVNGQRGQEQEARKLEDFFEFHFYLLVEMASG